MVFVDVFSSALGVNFFKIRSDSVRVTEQSLAVPYLMLQRIECDLTVVVNTLESHPIKWSS